MPVQDLTIAESNRLSSKFYEYIITFNKKNCRMSKYMFALGF